VIEYDIRTYLLTQSGVTDIIGAGNAARCHVAHAPQEAKYPMLVLELVSDVPEYMQATEAGVTDARIVVHALAAKGQPTDDGYAKARTLGEAVRTALSGYRGAAGSSTVQAAFLRLQRPVYHDDAGVYEVTQDWEIGYA